MESARDPLPRIPDLTLPDRVEPAPLTPAPPPVVTPPSSVRSGPPQTVRRIGDPVLAPWEPQFLYPGVVAAIDGDRVSIDFDDGRFGWVMAEQVRNFALPVGQAVLAQVKPNGPFNPGRIRAIDADEVQVEFDSAATEWVEIAALRFACQPIGPAATQTLASADPQNADDLDIGDRVWAPWLAEMMFVGVIDQIAGGEAHIHFDDGDRGWVRLEQIVPYTQLIGLRIMGRWKMGGHYYPGTITRTDAQRVYIEYDDGDREWTTPAALARPCQPMGPPARATKTVWRFPWGTWIWIAIIVFGAVARGCR